MPKLLAGLLKVALPDPVSSVSVPVVAVTAPEALTSPPAVVRSVVAPPNVVAPLKVCPPLVRTNAPLMESVLAAAAVKELSAEALPTVLFNETAPVPVMSSATVPSTAPPSVKLAPPPALIRVSLARVIGPPMEAVPVPVSAPTAPTPVPFSVTASVPIATLLISKVAPLATVVPPAVVPSAAALAATKVPALTVVKPVYVFAPERMNVPVPCLVSATVPLGF